MNKIISSKIIALTFSILVICFTVGFYIFAWTGPTAAPPSNNTSAPINTGSEAQTKQGNLTIGTATIKGDSSISTNLNSDKVDDLHAADLLAQSGGEKGIYYLKCGLLAKSGCYYSSYPSTTCTPPSCATGDTNLGTGCVYTDLDIGTLEANYYSKQVSTYSPCGGDAMWFQGFAGYCERVCYKE